MNLVVIGAGGHAKVVVDTARMAGWQVLGVSDDRPSAILFDLPYLGSPNNLAMPEDYQAIIAIGSNLVRQRMAHELSRRITWATIVHPKAVVSGFAVLQPGTVVLAGAVIQAAAKIGQHVIINTSASIDHDCQIADFCHIAPNAVLTGGVVLETGVLIGAGSVVTPMSKIGEWTILGAGGAAVRNLDSHGVFMGVPARRVRRL